MHFSVYYKTIVRVWIIAENFTIRSYTKGVIVCPKRDITEWILNCINIANIGIVIY